MATAPFQTEAFDARDLAPEVARCAIEVTPGRLLSLAAIFDADLSVAGTYRFNVMAQSGSGRSVSQQANRFDGGSFAAPHITLNADARIHASLNVMDQNGGQLCYIEIEYPRDQTASTTYARRGMQNG